VSDVKRSCECPHNGNGNGEGLLLAEQRPMGRSSSGGAQLQIPFRPTV
jgi:hypothetical protein